MFAALLSACVAVPSLAQTALPVYGGPGNGTGFTLANPYLEIHSINNSGVAVTWGTKVQGVSSNGPIRAFRWTPTGALDELTSVNGGAFATRANAINNSGTIVGNSNTAATGFDTVATRYAPGSVTPIALDKPITGGPSDASANAINNNGFTAGAADVVAGRSAITWDTNSTAATLIGTVSGGTASQSEVYAVNTFNVMAGIASLSNGTTDLGTRAVRWNGVTAGVALQPGGLNTSGQANDFANDINALGTIAGRSHHYSNDKDLGIVAVKWNAGVNTVTLLQTLGNDASGHSNSNAISINFAGTCVGYAEKFTSGGAALGSRPVRWSPAGSVTELQTFNTAPDAVTSGYAYAINGMGTIGGSAQLANGQSHAALWLANSVTPLDVNSLISVNSGWQLTQIKAVTDTGFVAGTGVFNGTITRTFSMLVPQAGTYGLGDANFDAGIHFDDLLILATHYGQPSGGSVNAADFDLNGVTDFSDLLTLAKHYSGSAAGLALATSDAFADDFALAQSLVPEPGTFAGMAGAFLMVVTRARARSLAPGIA